MVIIVRDGAAIIPSGRTSWGEPKALWRQVKDLKHYGKTAEYLEYQALTRGLFDMGSNQSSEANPASGKNTTLV